MMESIREWLRETGREECFADVAVVMPAQIFLHTLANTLGYFDAGPAVVQSQVAAVSDVLAALVEGEAGCYGDEVEVFMDGPQS